MRLGQVGAMKDEMAQLGLRANELIAGFSGGLVSALTMRNVTTAQAVASVLAGTLTANYLGEYAQRWLSLSSGAAAFLLGLVAMVVCQSIIEQARRWHPPKPPGGR